LQWLPQRRKAVIFHRAIEGVNDGILEMRRWGWIYPEFSLNFMQAGFPTLTFGLHIFDRN
jgi:hypothetical protein